MEGVPLQLIIVIVIGVAALGILVGWLAMAGDPDPVLDDVSTDPQDITIKGDGRVTSDVDVEIYVYDSERNEVDDVIVTLSGSVDETVTQKIDSGDRVRITARLADGTNTGKIKVVAEKGGGMGSTETTIIVIRG